MTNRSPSSKSFSSSTTTKSSGKSVLSKTEDIDDVDHSIEPEFIYGGPFIAQPKPGPFVNTTTPVNMCLQGTFKRSFAYYSIKERLPVILTKVIDYLSREGGKVKSSSGATDDEIKSAIKYISKLKNEIMTNKKFEPLSVDTEEAQRWNTWITQSENQYYFSNTWLFTECYVYRRLREAFELQPKLNKFDPFSHKKEESLSNETCMENMCMVAARMSDMLVKGGKDKTKADFVMLLKLCLWSNKCDLSLSLGSVHNMLVDPFKMVVDLKDKLLVDDTGKAADLIMAKSQSLGAQIQGPSEDKTKPPPTPAPGDGEGAPEERPQIPCPAKMVLPTMVFMDIVCDNAGYELFTDLCLGHFLVAQEIVKKIRYHVKKIPWFVSDVTIQDFRHTIEACSKSQFSKKLEAPAPVEGEEAPPPPMMTSEGLQALGKQWAAYLADGTFEVMDDDFWTSPHPYKDMKKYDPHLYRKLQFAVAILFKGDLNYRKLLGEKNWNPTTAFEPCLQGFIPAPIVAARTVKSDLICGLPKGKYEQINKLDEEWMRKGDYGVISFCPKAEPLKVSDKPCWDYGNGCQGAVCPTPSVV